MVIVTGDIQLTANNQSGFISYAVTGTTTAGPLDSTATIAVSSGAGGTGLQQQASTVSTITITAGSNNIFTLNYKVSSGNVNFSNRTLTVIPLN
jgi:hypothetical protein